MWRIMLPQSPSAFLFFKQQDMHMHHRNWRTSGPPTNQDAIAVSLRRSQPPGTSLVSLTPPPNRKW